MSNSKEQSMKTIYVYEEARGWAIGWVNTRGRLVSKNGLASRDAAKREARNVQLVVGDRPILECTPPWLT